MTGGGSPGSDRPDGSTTPAIPGARTDLAARLVGPRAIAVGSVERAGPVAGAVVVAIDRCAIGRSDLEAWRAGAAPTPAWFGHQWVGRVVAVGAGVTGRFEGERVVGATCPPCGACGPCRAGFGTNCELALAMIAGADPLAPAHGGFARSLQVDARRVHRVPEGLDDDAAALAEVAATALRSVTRAGPTVGDMVAVVGAGLTGQLVAQLARLAGAGRVVLIDQEPAERELACSLVADAAFAPGPAPGRWLAGHGHGLGADLVFECTGATDSAGLALSLARPGGRVVLVGVSGQGPSLPAGNAMAGELTIVTSRGYGAGEVGRALDLMADDRLRVDSLIGGVVGFDGLSRAFETLAAGAGGTILFNPSI